MRLGGLSNGLWTVAILCFLLVAAVALAGIQNMAVVVSAGSKLSDVPLADLAKVSKGFQKTWPDRKNFTR